MLVTCGNHQRDRLGRHRWLHRHLEVLGWDCGNGWDSVMKKVAITGLREARIVETPDLHVAKGCWQRDHGCSMILAPIAKDSSRRILSACPLMGDDPVRCPLEDSIWHRPAKTRLSRVLATPAVLWASIGSRPSGRPSYSPSI